MKTIATILISTILFMTINAQEKNETNATASSEVIYRGEKISEEGAIPASQLVGMMKGKEEQRVNVKVEAKIVECCQNRGCWMQVDLGNGKLMRVTFKDYGFFVPKDCPGKTVIMDGAAYYKTVPVSQLKHYAEDAGKSKKEIQAITEPEHDLAFEATGVIIK